MKESHRYSPHNTNGNRLALIVARMKRLAAAAFIRRRPDGLCGSLNVISMYLKVPWKNVCFGTPPPSLCEWDTKQSECAYRGKAGRDDVHDLFLLHSSHKEQQHVQLLLRFQDRRRMDSFVGGSGQAYLCDAQPFMNAN